MPDKRILTIVSKYVTLGARVAAGTVFIGAALVLVGWTVDGELLKSGAAGFTPMNPLTAVLFMLSAVALWIATSCEAGRKRLALVRLLSVVVMLGGLVPLLAYLFGWQPYVDSLLFAPSLNGNRMAPNTAVHFEFIALSLLLLDVRYKHFRLCSQAFACLAIIASIISLLGYLFGARSLYGITSHIPMGLNTALLFTFLSAGVLCMRPKEGVPALLASSNIGSVMARRLLPAAVGISCLLGFLRLLGERAGFYETEFGVAAMVILNIVMLSAAVLYTALILNRMDVERKQGVEALKDSAARYRFLADSIPGIMWTATPDGAVDYCNQRWYAYTGLTFEQTREAGWQTAIHPDDRESCVALWNSSLGRVTAFETEVRLKNGISGDYRWHLLRGHPRRDEEGELAQWVGTCTDVHEQRRVANELAKLNSALEERIKERVAELAEANEDLRQKNQENEMFVYSVSHDLRSPLVNLQGFSKELSMVAADLQELIADPSVPAEVSERAKALLSGDLRESIRFIQTAVLRLSGIIDALLSLSRVGRVEYHFQQVDMHAMVNRILESMQATLVDKGVEVQVQSLSPCQGDTTAVEQLFANLIGNAVKYLDPQRPGRIEVGEIEKKGHQRTYYVKDNGLGIAQAYHEKVFETFKRFHPQAAPGDGMGLAIVRRIVERHGGEIGLESKEGRGSTFFVTLSDRVTVGSSLSAKKLTKEGDDNAIRIDSHLVGGR